MRTLNSAKNMMSGIVFQILYALLGFVVRTVFRLFLFRRLFVPEPSPVGSFPLFRCFEFSAFRAVRGPGRAAVVNPRGEPARKRNCPIMIP